MLTEPAFSISLKLDHPAEQPLHASMTGEPGVEWEPWVDAVGRDYGYIQRIDQGYRVHLYGVGSYSFDQYSACVRGTPDPGVGIEAFRSTFYRDVLPLVLHGCAWEVLHASGLSIAGTCVAFCGDSQAGKSTLARAGAERGWEVFADDAIPFRIRDATVPIHPIPFQIRLRGPARQYFAHISTRRDPSVTDRAESVRPRPRCLERIIALDRREDEHDGSITLERLTPSRALPILLRQAYCLGHWDRTRTKVMVATYISLAALLPIFRLTYPSGMDHLDATLDRLRDHIVETGLGTR
jgi:hypothetical protein